MTRTIRISLAVAVVALCCLLVAWLDAAALSKGHERTMDRVEVVVTDSTLHSFVSKSDVEEILREECGTLVGVRLDSLGLRHLETALKGNGAIRSCEAYSTPDGVLHIDVSQREPIILFDTGKSKHYADKEGYLFPKVGDAKDDVTMIDGALPIDVPEGFRGVPETEDQRNWLKGIISMMDFLKGKPAWANAIKRISIDADGNLVLYPREGKETFLFGHPTDIAAKFAKVEDYYKYIAPTKDEGYYGVVNVKFDGQIVCTPAKKR